MKEHPLLPRQRYAFLLTAVSAPAVVTASRLSYVWVLTVTLLAAAIAVGLHVLQSRSPLPLAQATRRVWGKGFGTVILAGQFLFAAVFLWQLALGSDAAFPDENTVPFVPLTLLAVCAWAAFQGRAACIRAVGVLFFFLAALYLTVFAFAVPEMEWQRLAPSAPAGDLLPLGVVLLLPLWGQYLLSPREERGRFPVWFLAAFVFLPTAASAACAAVPGSRGSFYTMAKSVEVLSFAQRIEPLVSVAQTVGWFAALCLTAVTAGELAAAVGVAPRWGALAACALAAVGVVSPMRLSPVVLLSAGAVFCIFFPLLTQAIVPRKKV